jgi:hypothetical protein
VSGLHGLVIGDSDSEGVGGWADVGEEIRVWHIVASGARVENEGRGGAWLSGSLCDGG